MTIGEEIMTMLRQKAESKWEYYNPHFLTELTDLIHSYYQIEDGIVYEWIRDMFGA